MMGNICSVEPVNQGLLICIVDYFQVIIFHKLYHLWITGYRIIILPLC